MRPNLSEERIEPDHLHFREPTLKIMATAQRQSNLYKRLCFLETLLQRKFTRMQNSRKNKANYIQEGWKYFNP